MGVGGMSESMKKENFVTKIFFSDKCCVRFFQITDVNVIKDLVAVSYKLLEDVPSKLQIQ